jgi:large subunit ribosomal protein L18
MALTKSERRLRIKRRVRKNVEGTTEKPRLSVFRSNKEIYAQVINDETKQTIVAASSLEKDLSTDGTKSDVAKAVGMKVAERAMANGVEQITFDRNGYLYHGRIKSLAEGAREAGLKF